MRAASGLAAEHDHAELPGEAQGHSLGDSANPRGDEDWFVVVPSGSGL